MSVTEPNVRAIQAKVYDIPDTDKLVGLNPSGDAIEFPEVISFNYYESLFESFIRDRDIYFNFLFMQNTNGNCILDGNFNIFFNRYFINHSNWWCRYACSNFNA